MELANVAQQLAPLLGIAFEELFGVLFSRYGFIVLQVGLDDVVIGALIRGVELKSLECGLHTSTRPYDHSNAGEKHMQTRH